MTPSASPPAFFPGGMETAPEATPGGCAHPPCLCPVEAGRKYCCPACARTGPEADACRCGHFGCSGRLV